MKKIYVSAWILLAAATLVSALTGTFNPAALVVFSLVALGLIYTFALWAVIVNTQNTQTE